MIAGGSSNCKGGGGGGSGKGKARGGDGGGGKLKHSWLCFFLC